MKSILALTAAVLVNFSAGAQYIVYDPAMNVQQILDTAQEIAKQVEQINVLTSQLQQLQQYNIAFGNPAVSVNIVGANPLVSDLNLAAAGQSIVTIQTGSQGVEAMTFDANGLYHNIGQSFQTPSGNQVQREEDIYRENAAAQNATLNYTNVYNNASQRRQSLRADIAATVQKLQAATTASEVQKLSGVLVGLDADLADTDKEIDQAANLALVQNAENRNDNDKQGKARLEEQQSEFSEAITNYGTAFQPPTEAATFPLNNFMTAETPLRETQPAPASSAPQVPRPRFNPTRLFVEKDRLAWFWFLFAMAILIMAAADRYFLVQSFKQRERVVVIDPANTYYVAPVLKFEEAKELHAQQSELAAIALLERNPDGFDNEDLLKQMFLKTALENARAEQRSEDAEFKAKELHQKVEIARIDILTTRADAVLTQITGQLIRAGIFDDKAFSEAVPFHLTLKLVRNPNMLLNGRFPTAVSDFKYEILH